jgi:spermidine synthase
MYLELRNPFADETGVIRLLEPPDCDRQAIVDRVLSGTYGKPFVLDDGVRRALYFTRAWVQSEMRIADPVALEFRYSQKVMAFLLFVPEPRHILIVGLGGGSIAKFCHRHLPGAQLTALEVDPHVIAFREQFLVPPDDGRFRVIEADGAVYVTRCEETYDLIVLDAFGSEGVSPSMCTREFYQDTRDITARDGVVVVNLVGRKEERIAHLDMLRTVFGDNILLVPVEDDGNYVAFVFRNPAFEPRWRAMAGQAQALQARFGLDFPRFAAQLERSRKLGYLERTLREVEAG